MILEVVEEDKEKIKLELKGETHTLSQVLATEIWKEGGDAASIQEHPFMEEVKIIVSGNNPRKLIDKALISIQNQCDELKEEFHKALKK
jgi:DNA-directed RNA polymerase subunit L